MSWSPVKGFSLFLFLVQKSVIPAPKHTTTSHHSWLQSYILLKTTLTPHPSPFIGPESTPSASIKFFLDSSFSVFLNADPNHTIFLKMIPLKTPPTQLLCLFRCFLLVLLTTTWQSLLSRAVHRHEASRQPRVNFFPICSSVGFVVFLFSRWITQSVFLIPSDWQGGTMWNINVMNFSKDPDRKR